MTAETVRHRVLAKFDDDDDDKGDCRFRVVDMKESALEMQCSCAVDRDLVILLACATMMCLRS